ncbi:MAG: HAD-IA family hydrolase [Candidatus Woesearchaeota archaeon]|jgi:phosphoglycolate phosphatase
MTIKLILFDFDGTLADAFPIILKNVNELSEKYKYNKIKASEISGLKDMSLKEILKKYNISLFKFLFLTYDMKKRINKDKSKIKIFQNIKPVVKELSKKYKIGIITKNKEDIVREILKKEKIESYFNFVITDKTIFKKEKTIKKTIKEHKLNNDEVIYIGDERRDVVSCKKANVKVISVTWGFNSKKGLQKENPDYLVDKPKEILTIIKKI